MLKDFFGTRRGIVTAAGLVAIVAVLVLWRAIGAAPRAQSAPPPVPVSVVAVEQRAVAHTVSGIGSVRPLHTVTVRPQVDGVVTDVRFAEGQTVKRGELLASIDDRAIVAGLRQAQAQKARNEALLRSAELDLRRYDSLATQAAVSKQMLEQQRANVQQLRAAILADDAAIAQQEVLLSYTRVTSPIDGRVGLRRVDPGNLVQANDAGGFVTVTQLDPISVVFTLPQEQLSRVQPLLQSGQPAPVSAYERTNGALLGEGRLTVVDNEIDAATGTVRLRAEFANPKGSLWPGQFVTVELQTNVIAAATVVPLRALRQGVDGHFVFRVRANTAEVVPVSVVYEDDEIAVLSQGVQRGDTVVSDGHSRLKPGAAVRVGTQPTKLAARSAQP